jgi:hypothetical protein
MEMVAPLGIREVVVPPSCNVPPTPGLYDPARLLPTQG